MVLNGVNCVNMKCGGHAVIVIFLIIYVKFLSEEPALQAGGHWFPP